MLKTLFDKVVAGVGLLLLAPLLFAIFVLIKTKMGDGGVLFRQQRVGYRGELFTIYKFRTMVAHAAGSSVTVAGESRITPLGRVLRKYKLDELPELWNVLVGDMSLVGPRPDVPGYADRLSGEDRKILLLRPGLTGPASLKYRNEEYLLSQVEDPEWYNDNVIYPDKVRLNLYYFQHPSFGKDLEMIFCTLFHRRMSYAGEKI